MADASSVLDPGFEVINGVKFWTKAQVDLLSMPHVDLRHLEQVVGGPVSKFWSAADQESDDFPVSPAEILMEFAGRACYQSFGVGRDSKDYFENILSSKHGSVLEHANFSFYFQGVSRSFTHELVRHRAGFAYSQLSQRYVDASDTAFVVPWAMRGDGAVKDALRYEFMRECANQLSTYRRIAEIMHDEAQAKFPDAKTDARKWQRQTARCILGNATETKIVTTANLRSWRHFLGMRGAMAAEGEIRAVAIEVSRILQQQCPLVFDDVVECIDEGSGETYLKLGYEKV